MHLVASVHPSVCRFVCRGSPPLCQVQQRAKKSRYQSKMFVCVSTYSTDAVDRILIFVSFYTPSTKEYVASLIELYIKNNGAVRVLVIISPLSSNFTLPELRCIARCTPYFDTKLHRILPWADINRNCNIFF